MTTEKEFMMFDSAQAAADKLKAALYDPSVDKRARNRVFGDLHRLERCGWHDRAFADAMQQAGVSFDGENFVFANAVPASIEKLISIYLKHMGQDDEENYFIDIFDMHEAAAYLEISYDTLKGFVSRQRIIRGKEVGKGMIFTRKQLDEFKKSSASKINHKE